MFFGNQMWQAGDQNPANFAFTGPTALAARAGAVHGNQTSDSFIGAPLATGSPAYPSLGETSQSVPPLAYFGLTAVVLFSLMRLVRR